MVLEGRPRDCNFPAAIAVPVTNEDGLPKGSVSAIILKAGHAVTVSAVFLTSLYF